ncbi:MAG: 3-phosphoshikimate 1-carboxyvinyltransferase [Dysgonamonadaceae bacterium]|jgi:3-phosphoshikimate 1-carboxyvinyltransferase|nr:3-phosphoshikimate 1-carboxyvinyltransferase [Dysgonamonadaceae bacterium]
MQYTVHKPIALNTDIQLPASKSISNRALIINALCKNAGTIENLSDADDTRVMLQALTTDQNIIDVEAAGTSMRFLTAYFASQPGERIITGTARMKNRPIALLVNALRQIGADIDYVEKEGYPPLRIKGKTLEGGQITLDGSVSSQFISALMMIAPATQNGLVIKLEGQIVSKPYIRMTQHLMEIFGIKVSWTDHTISIPPQPYHPVSFMVENDWSAASYWYEILSLAETGSEITLKGLHKKSFQGDAKIAQLFEVLGVSTKFTEKGAVLQKTERLVSPLMYNFQHEPDLAQTFVVTCALKNVPFQFSGLQSLKIKETDRMIALQNEMKKLGYTLAITEDHEISWAGVRAHPEKILPIRTYEDHRMAMSFAPAALVVGEIAVQDPEVVSKSYPSYWKDLEKAGFRIEVCNK